MSFEFKDAFRELIETNGGLADENLGQIAAHVRNYKPDFSVLYLWNLLNGYPPSNDDRRAIAKVLEPGPQKWLSAFWPIEDHESRRSAMLVSRRVKSHELVKDIVEDMKRTPRFRNSEPSELEINFLVEEYLDKNRLEEDQRAFFCLGR